MSLLENLLKIKRGYKKAIASLLDIIFLSLAIYISFSLNNQPIENHYKLKLVLTYLILVPSTIFVFYYLGLYKTVLRYISNDTLIKLAFACLASTTLLMTLNIVMGHNLNLITIFIFFSLTLILTAGSRLIFSLLVNKDVRDGGEPVIIYGAGAAGRQAAIALLSSSEFKPIAFVDDDSTLHNTLIQGIYVYPSNSISKIIKQLAVNKILLAMPSIKQNIKQNIINTLNSLPVKVLTLPSMPELISGEKHYSDLKEIDIEDLLGRETIPPRADLISKNITGKNVLISGAGGSIGSELSRQVLKQSPNKLILFEVSEFNLYQIEKELIEIKKQLSLKTSIYPILGNVQDKNLLKSTMSLFSIKTVYHAAAYKHVPLVEYNIVAGTKNNIIGTYNTVTAAIESNVETFVLISTDKAVRPTNIMGATKRFSEMILQAVSKNLKNNTMTISMVRFGNVLGSSGSVVPLFKKQIAQGGPVTVTHKEITRFFMTIPEASQLVIQAGAMSKGGDVFVLDMGNSVKIHELACKMIKLSQLTIKNDSNPSGDIEISFTGLRPGEKLYEELLIGENVTQTAHPRIMTANETFLYWEELEPLLNTLKYACEQQNSQLIQQTLLSAKTGYNPTSEICDIFVSEGFYSQ
ncbi:MULTISPECIES: polysaccharide biosynthesis protein [unclassified Providencia]|uniref:polysaccharide biosynthesis protein n=1 Tax=unclassified Providencia TaxID=2633465 RepID=UPI0012B5BADB|nr:MULTISPECIES: nucleoside-diphosphate sugar epimerase/dehydratase [unclassified Providencia]MTC22290.1 NAD-dependent epimerase/dehydratase family protein [Providencia sp. wls1938]